MSHLDIIQIGFLYDDLLITMEVNHIPTTVLHVRTFVLTLPTCMYLVLANIISTYRYRFLYRKCYL